MNKSKRIYADIDNPNEKNIKVILNQDTSFLEILTLKISQKEAYQFFNADYGVLVGRVIANGGVGIPNAKVSIFIPITDEDKKNAEIFAAYPYENPRDKNHDSKRYNLLPRVASEDPETGSFKPKQPFGSFPTKDEIVTNDTWLEVYEKYYKYTTVTNEAGDYMLFGVPTGVQTVHMSVDITDIGKYSMTPADMVVQLGYSDAFFNSDLTIKGKQDLEDLPHIETQEISVEVIPYWGDSTNFEIGITRQDFRIRAELVNNFTVFGSFFTQGRLAVNGDPDRDRWDVGFYRLSEDYWNNIDFRTNRISDVDIRVFTYPPSISQDIIDNDISTSGTTVDPQTDILLVDSNSYYENKKNGMFVLSIPCNRKKIITDQLGNEVIVADDSSVGVFTEFLGMFIIEGEDIPIEKNYSDTWKRPNSPNNARTRFKIPQKDFNIREERVGGSTYNENVKESNIWRKKYYKFNGGNFYSIAQFFPTKYANDNTNEDRKHPDTRGNVNNLNPATINFVNTIGAFKIGGTVRTIQEDLDNINLLSGGTSGLTPDTTFLYDFPYNAIDTTHDDDLFFGAQWINFSIYFPQINWTFGFTVGDDRDQNMADTWFKDYRDGKEGVKGEWFTHGRSDIQKLMGGFVNTRLMCGRGIQTDFCLSSKKDIIMFSEINRKGFRKNDDNLNSIILTGNYKYRTPSTQITPSDLEYTTTAHDINYVGSANPYFFKGMYNTDCIQLLLDLNFI